MHRRNNLKHTHHRIACPFLEPQGETGNTNNCMSQELGDSKSNLSNLFHGVESLPGSFLFKGRGQALPIKSLSPLTLSLGSTPEYIPTSASKR